MTELADVNADVVAAYRRQRQAEQRLRALGLDAERLTKLCRQAVIDYYAETGGSLGGDRLDDAVSFVRERMLVEVERYDPERAGGVSVTTWLYRRSKQRVIDWLRTRAEGLEFGDARSGGAGRVGLTDDGELEPARAASDLDTIEQAAARLAGGLSERSQLTLRALATAAAEDSDLVNVLEGLLRDLADELEATLPDDLRGMLRRRENRSAEAIAAMVAGGLAA